MGRVKTPQLVTFLLSQINKGFIPTKEELEDVFVGLPAKYYKDIALALLHRPTQAQPARPVSNGNDAGLEIGKVPSRVNPRRQQAPTVSPTKALTPGDLSDGSSVLGNS